MAIVDTIRTMAAPIAEAHDCAIYDVVMGKEKLMVSVTRTDGVDLDTVARITRELSHLLDESDPISNHYTLEVSSPGLERALRIPSHFAGAVGDLVTIKTKPNVEEERRHKGTLIAADDDACTLQVDGSDETKTFTFDQIDKARTIFEWGPTPKKGQPKSPGSAKADAGTGAAPTLDPDIPSTKNEVKS